MSDDPIHPGRKACLHMSAADPLTNATGRHCKISSIPELTKEEIMTRKRMASDFTRIWAVLLSRISTFRLRTGMSHSRPDDTGNRLNGIMIGSKRFRVGLMIALACQLALFSWSGALAQGTSDVVGTWTLVSSVTERDGMKTDQFGSGAKGMLSLDSGGHFMLTILGPELPRFASNNRAHGTPEENKEVVSKSIAMIGTYSVDPAQKTLTFKVDSATFPNWNGTEQKRLLSLGNRDELRYVTPTASSGGVGTVVWKRAN
ncbi:MAG: lipocalin-like domain-containing protein [Polaromonas sp.]